MIDKIELVENWFILEPNLNLKLTIRKSLTLSLKRILKVQNIMFKLLLLD